MLKLVYQNNQWGEIMLTKDEVKAVQEKYSVKTIFSQNAKMKKSSTKGIHVYNWGIPAFKSKSGLKTCPNATKCAVGCYAKMGAYVWSNVANAYEGRLSLSQDQNFESVIKFHVEKLVKKHPKGTIMVRIHDSGDFYSEEYYQAWKNIAAMFLDNERIQFYAYTKMVVMGKNDTTRPKNFNLIYSYDGSEDKHINTAKDRHSKVFESVEQLLAAGYVNASEDDMLALSPNVKVGLVYHGNKNFNNTTWGKVA